jgi:hypothetical protein
MAKKAKTKPETTETEKTPVVENKVANAETFLDRLRVEKSDLDLKINKLEQGLASGKVPASEHAILRLQLSTMQHYSKILETRIARA